MNKIFLSLMLITIALSSCRIPYDPEIETDLQVPVVDAFLTNHQGGNYVRLTKALPYNADDDYNSLSNATVYLTDDTESVYYFDEISRGYYEPADNSFAGVVNKTYTLTVVTPDGNTYVSKPETLLPEMEPSSVYGGYDQVESLSEDAYGRTVKVTEDVCAMYFDYMGDITTPRFRYNSSQLIEYYYTKGLVNFFCCWTSLQDNSLRFTNEKYASSSINIYKQEVCTVQPAVKIRVKDIAQKPDGFGSLVWSFNDSMVDAYEYKRIVTINQYRLNHDSYQFYKEVEAQSAAGGKIFDPVTSQLHGNMICKTDSLKPVFGFFEVSYKSMMTYTIKRNGIGNPVNIVRINNVSPPSPEGFKLNTPPDFWIP